MKYIIPEEKQQVAEPTDFQAALAGAGSQRKPELVGADREAWVKVPTCKHTRKRYKLVGLNLKWTCLNCLYFELVPATTEPGRWEDSPLKDAKGE